MPRHTTCPSLGEGLQGGGCLRWREDGSRCWACRLRSSVGAGDYRQLQFCLWQLVNSCSSCDPPHLANLLNSLPTPAATPTAAMPPRRAATCGCGMRCHWWSWTWMPSTPASTRRCIRLGSQLGWPAQRCKRCRVMSLHSSGVLPCCGAICHPVQRRECIIINLLPCLHRMMPAGSGAEAQGGRHCRGALPQRRHRVSTLTGADRFAVATHTYISMRPSGPPSPLP